VLPQAQSSDNFVYEQPRILKMQLNQRILEDKKVLDKLIENFGHQVRLRKLDGSDVIDESIDKLNNS